MAFFMRGIGKAGTDILGGVVHGAGKLVEDVGEATGSAGIAGGVVGGVMEGTGKAIESVGEATEDLGEAVFGKKENKPKTLKDIVLDQIDKDYGDDMKMEDFKDSDEYKDLLKKYDEEIARQEEEIARQEEGEGDDEDSKADDAKEAEAAEEEEDEEIDEAEKKLMRSEEGTIVEQSDDEEDGEEASKVIPKHFSLRSNRNKRYLRYINEDEESDGLLRYSSKNVVGPYSKFAIRASKTEPGFVHIRCCYNNKFWVCRSEDSKYIAAVANEEEDDKSKWSCTLFEPVLVPEKNGYYFRHVQLNTFLCLAEGDPAPYKDCLVARVEDLTTIDEDLVLSSAVDWDSIFILPKYVAFKCNNDCYLEPSGKYLKFSASNVEDPSVAFEVIPMEDGYIRMKHVESGKYWIRSPNWIHCDSINTGKDDPNTLFWPVKVDNKFVALRNKGNNRFCKRLTTEGKTNCLNAAVSTITETARLEAIEIVIARSIDNVDYRLNDARVYNKKILTVAKGIAINNTEVADKVTFKFRYERKVERTWGSSVSSTFGIATRFKSKIPTVGTLKFSFEFEVSSENTREETEKEKSFEETAETITVPPMSKVKFSGIITQASCDVPFSYTQRDTLKDGKQVTHRFEDGIFTGVTTFDYKFETEKLPL